MNEKPCFAENCTGIAKGRRYCPTHAYRMRRYGSLELPRTTESEYEERFWSKVNKTDACWEWTTGEQHGYGTFWDGYGSVRSHIWAYEKLIGPIPDGVILDHACRNRRCVRPDVKHVRLADYGLNSQNLANLNPSTVTGIRGVYFDRRSGKYGARVGLAGVMHYAGYFDTAEEAAEAVRLKRLELHSYNEEDRS